MTVAEVFPHPMMNLGKPSNRRQILRCELENELEFLPGVLKFSDFNERAPQGDVGGEIRRMAHQTVPAGFDSFLESFGASVFLGEGGKRNRRRVRLDPAFQFFDAR